MKKMNTIFSFFIIVLVSSATFAQTFYTGKMGVALESYGRIRIFSDDNTTRQIDRVSLLVAGAQGQVFNYIEDPENILPVTTVVSPNLSDHELTVSTNNTFSNLPPAVEVATNIYGWTDGGYILVKMNIKNIESALTLTGPIGLEILPQIDNEYGNEAVKYDPNSGSILINKTGWVALKFLSQNLTSAKFFEYFEDFGNDNDFYTWLTQGTIDQSYASGADGAVIIAGGPANPVAPGASVDFYFAVSVGTSETEVLDRIQEAERKYSSMTTDVEDEISVVDNFNLYQNYPNPFNPTTKIRYELRESSEVILKVYDLLGNEVASLVEGNKPAGNYEIDFNAEGLSSGVYFYTLISGNFTQTKKMTLIR